MTSVSSDDILKNFVIDGSERSVQDIVSKLGFIAKIKEGDIVDVGSLSLMPYGMKTSAYRTVTNFVGRRETKEKTLNFYRSVIGEAFNLATFYLKSNEEFFQKIGQMIVVALQEAKAGLLNHIKTYIKHNFHISEIETLIKTLDTKTDDLTVQIANLKRIKHTSRQKPSRIPKPEVLQNKHRIKDPKFD